MTRAFDYLATPLTTGASALDDEKALLGPYFSVPLAGSAPLDTCARLCAGTIALVTTDRNIDFNFGVLAVERVFQRNFHIIAQVGTASRAALLLLAAEAAATAAKYGFEYIANVIERSARKTAAAGIVAAAVGECRVAVTIICRALLRVLQDVIGFADRLEFGFCCCITGILVRVPLHRQLAIGGFQRRAIAVTRDVQLFVIVNFGCHIHASQ